jgi:hypothetical protein
MPGSCDGISRGQQSRNLAISGEMVMIIYTRSRKTGYAFRTSERKKEEAAQRQKNDKKS